MSDSGKKNHQRIYLGFNYFIHARKNSMYVYIYPKYI